MSKIIFTDLDGTLLNSERLVSEGNKKAIKEWTDAGNYFVMTSGRSVHGIRVVLDQLDDLHNIILASFHGGLIVSDVNKSKIFYEHTMDSSAAAKALDVVYSRGIYGHAFSDKGLIIPEENDLFRDYHKNTREAYTVMKSTEDLLDEKIYKVITLDHEHEDKLIALKEEIDNGPLSPYVDTFFSSTYFLEIVPKGINKALAVRKLSEILGIDIKDTIAVGDERNDISMVEAAGRGYAVQNARPELKCVADHVTEHDNNHEAIAEIIYKNL